MKHYLINPGWQCHNNCSYCWVRATVNTRPELYHAKPRPAEDWIAAINRDKPDLVDIAGGEPLLTGYIPELIAGCPETRFGLSTNGLEQDEISRLCAVHPPNLIAINVSYHPDAALRWQGYRTVWQMAVTMFRAHGYNVASSIVDYEDAVERAVDVLKWLGVMNIPYSISPYEESKGLGILGQPLKCKGGINHLTVAPDGTTWPCLTGLRSPDYERYILGNWLDGTIDLRLKPEPCRLHCADYYILKDQHQAGDMWHIEAEPVE